MMRIWRLSVAYIEPQSRTARPRKTKTDTEVAHVKCDWDTTFKVKRSKVKATWDGGILWRPPAQLANIIIIILKALVTVTLSQLKANTGALYITSSRELSVMKGLLEKYKFQILDRLTDWDDTKIAYIHAVTRWLNDNYSWNENKKPSGCWQTYATRLLVSQGHAPNMVPFDMLGKLMVSY